MDLVATEVVYDDSAASYRILLKLTLYIKTNFKKVYLTN